MAFSSGPRIVIIFGTLFVLFGVLEYVIIACVHNGYSLDYGTASLIKLPKDYSQRFGKIEWQRLKKINDLNAAKQLEIIGKRKSTSLASLVPSTNPPKKLKGTFESLVNNLIEKVDRLHSKLDLAVNERERLLRFLSNFEYQREGTDLRLRPILGREYEIPTDINISSTTEPELLVENDTSLTIRELTSYEAAGNNIMFTLRTIKKNHESRLPLLFSTWMTKVNKSNIFLMTDDRDEVWQKKVWKEGMHYVLSTCDSHISESGDREDMLCCRTGTEMAQIFKPRNKNYDWLCHIDDDMYVRLPPLVSLLSRFDPKKDHVYLGRSGSEWGSPRKVLKGAKLGKEGDSYHFAVGGMYCLSRAMLELAKPYIVGSKNLTRSCAMTLEPDDVTIGFIVGVVLNKTLSRTAKIYTHGLHLISTVDPDTLDQQIAFSYGFGSTHWGYDTYNAIYVPEALYTFEEDESQFRSLHCHLYPKEPQCLRRSLKVDVDKYPLAI